jgi:outer membrane protein assembly factor BamD
VEEALVISISAYDYMDLQDLKEDTLRILKTNYPQNPMVSGKVVEDEKLWWKFWESLY